MSPATATPPPLLDRGRLTLALNVDGDEVAWLRLGRVDEPGAVELVRVVEAVADALNAGLHLDSSWHRLHSALAALNIARMAS